MRYFDTSLVSEAVLNGQAAPRTPHEKWWVSIAAEREAFHNAEENHGPLMGQGLGLRNSSAVLPRDAWLEMDAITRRIMRGDEGEAYMADLLPLAKPVHIGKIAVGYRISSDAGVVRMSISGQVPEVLGKTEYDYRKTLVPIFDSGYGRSWREWNSLESENFDALADDQENHVRAIKRRMAQYALDGNLDISFEDTQGYGIRNHPLAKSINLGSAAGGANIDLTTADADQVDAFITGPFGAMLDDNLITDPVNLYISREIARSWDKADPGSWAALPGGGFAPGSIMARVQNNRRIARIAVTSELSGNEFFWFVPKEEYIRPLIGMAVNTTAAVRLSPTADYNFRVMGAMGLEIRADWSGRSGVGHSVVVN